MNEISEGLGPMMMSVDQGHMAADGQGYVATSAGQGLMVTSANQSHMIPSAGHSPTMPLTSQEGQVISAGEDHEMVSFM